MKLRKYIGLGIAGIGLAGALSILPNSKQTTQKVQNLEEIVNIDETFKPQDIANFNSVLETLESKYPGIVKSLNLNVEAKEKKDFIPEAYAYSIAFDLEFIPEFQTALKEYFAFTDNEILKLMHKDLEVYNLLKERSKGLTEEQIKHFNRIGVNDNGKELLRDVDRSVIYFPTEDNAPLPPGHIDRKNAFAHELGHVVIGREDSTSNGKIYDLFDNITPYDIGSFVKPLSKPKSFEDYKNMKLRAIALVYGNLELHKKEPEENFDDNSIFNSRWGNIIFQGLITREIIEDILEPYIVSTNGLIAEKKAEELRNLKLITEINNVTLSGYGHVKNKDPLFTEDAAEIFRELVLSGANFEKPHSHAQKKVMVLDDYLREKYHN